MHCLVQTPRAARSLYEGTVGPEVLDIPKLHHQAGIFTYDLGFTSTASCESKISIFVTTQVACI
jgi:hypothetical protein